MSVVMEIGLLDAALGTRTTLRLTDANDPRVTQINGQMWIPAVGVTTISAESYFDGNFQQGVSKPSATFTIAISALREKFPSVMGLFWEAAPVTIWHGSPELAFSAWTKVFTGRVSDFPTVNGNFNVKADAENAGLASNVLTLTYTGGGGKEGTVDMTGRPKPWLAGKCLNVESVVIDQVYNVHQFHGYGPILAVDDLFERGSSFGPSLGDYASYAALVAATVPEGRWATCLTEGMIRLGAPPAGVITGDVRGDNPASGYIEKPGAVLMRIMANAGMTTADYSAPSFLGLDSDLSVWPNQGKIGISITGQETVESLVARMVAPCNAVAQVEAATGQLVVRRIGIDVASETILDAQGTSQIAVSSCERLTTSPPYHRIEMGAAISWRVHSADELATEDKWRGAWLALSVYSAGDIVSHTGGSTWRFIGTAPVAGSEPVAGNANWQQISEGMTPSDIGAIVTVRYPAPPPDDVAIGSLYIDQTATQYRFEGPIAMVGDAVLTLGGSILLTSGYVRVQDAAIGQAAQTSNWSGVINDDGDRPEDAADVTRVLSASPLVVTLRAKVGGDLYPDQLPVVIAPRFTKSGVLSNAAETWSFTATPGITATQDSSSTNERGKVTISAATASGTVLISVAGLTQAVRIDLVQDAAGSAGGAGAASAAITSYPAITTGSYPSAPPSTAIVQSDASGHLRFSAYWTYANGRILAGKHVYRVAGSGAAWTDVAAEAIGDAGLAGDYEPEFGDYTPPVDGVLSFAHTLTSLTPSTDYEFGVMLRRWSSSGTAEPVGGSIGEQR